jgi:hypothetical protein
LRRRKFSAYSDVWSFGVTCWEIYDFGSVPYGVRNNVQVQEFLNEGNRLGKPQVCPVDVWKIIYSCWEQQPSDRPSFSSIVSQMNQLKEAKLQDNYISLPSDNYS